MSKALPVYTRDCHGVYVRIKEQRDDYPPVNAGEAKRFLGVGDITPLEPWFAAALVAVGRAEYYAEVERDD